MSKQPKELSYEELKKGGYIVQRDPNYFTIRLRIPAGNLDSKQLIELGRIAEKFGRGRLHITTRQGIEIPWVGYERLGEITEELKKIGTPPGSCGPRVRNISACPGLPTCTHANINPGDLAMKIDERYFEATLPRKLKIAITGCPNSCAKPQVNDIGIMGVVKPKIIPENCTGCELCVNICKEAAIRMVEGRAVIDYSKCVYCGECTRVCPSDADAVDREGYTIYIGGRVGRHPQLGYKLVDFADEETIYRVIENAIELFGEEAAPRERFGGLINRMGVGEASGRLLA
ncbi:MAG: 4Fe-4S binding protein [Candidatus Bathyarchaeia archaeon]